MDYYKLPNIDVRLLVIFDEIRKHRSLTQAAIGLGLTQSAISRSLQRLRQQFGDPLFVRTPKGMEPTTRADKLAGPVSQILETYFSQMAVAPHFDPQTSRRLFTLHASDLGMAVLLPKLAKELKVRAPQVRLGAVQASQREVLAGLESGEIDVSVGTFANVNDGGIYQARLFSERYVCMVRAGHPLARAEQPISLDTYYKQSHIVVVTGKSGHVHHLAESMLLEAPYLDVAMTVPSFVLAAMLLRETDHVLTVPSGAVASLMDEFQLARLNCPVELPGFTVVQYWHERFHNDPASKWFRALVHDIFGDAEFLSEPLIAG